MRLRNTIAITALAALMLSGCTSNSTGDENDGVQSVTCAAVYADQLEVIEVTDYTMIVKPVEGSDLLQSGEEFTIELGWITDGNRPIVGDIYYIEYDGDILETAPAQFSNISKLELVERVNEPEVSTSVDVTVVGFSSEDNEFNVSPAEGTVEIMESDCFRLSYDDITDGTTPELGDVYHIEYSGEISGDYPAIFDGITSVEKVDATDEESESSETEEDLVEDETDEAAEDDEDDGAVG